MFQKRFSPGNKLKFIEPNHNNDPFKMDYLLLSTTQMETLQKRFKET